MEQSYFRCGFATISKRSGGDGRAGTVLGPGAQAGANVLEGIRFKQSGVATHITDAMESFDSSSKVLRKLRDELRSILGKLRRCARRRGLSATAKAWWNLLVESAEDLLNSTDCGQQFLLCELGKISNIVLMMSKAYKRDNPEAIGDGDDETDSESASVSSDSDSE